MSVLSEKVRNLPATPGVYLFKDARGEVLYVGKAKSLLHRVRSYLSPDPIRDELMGRAADVDVILTDSEVEALLLESSLVRQHRPRFNVLLKDDKSFPYVKVSVQEPYPRLSVTRQVRSDGARYLGPYTDVKLLRRTLREIRRIFPIRTCRNFEDYLRRNRPCLYYHIGRCMGPCTTRANVDPVEYRRMVDGLLLFLSGRDDELVRRLREEMTAAAEARDFELAARRRDQLGLLEKARVPQKMVRRGARDSDVIGIARHGGRAAVVTLRLRGGRIVGKEGRILERAGGLEDAAVLQFVLSQHYLHQDEVPPRLVMATAPAESEITFAALERRAGHRVERVVPQRGRERRLVAVAEKNAAHVLEDLEARRSGRKARFSPDMLDLQKALGLGSPPWRLVCVDVSNLGAEGAVAAVVASENGQPRKSLYRRMRIRRPGPDDFAMIDEAVARYWTHVESDELPRPDLVVIDGGIGQVGAARSALDRVATQPVELIGLAKKEEEVVREHAPPLHLPRRSAALRTLQRLRDEAHRFGLAYHRKLRGWARTTSELDRVPGIGPARRAALLRAFGSVEALSSATADEIAQRAHVPIGLASRIAEHLAARSVSPWDDPRSRVGGES